jgi:hypothetical protein
MQRTGDLLTQKEGWWEESYGPPMGHEEDKQSFSKQIPMSNWLQNATSDNSSFLAQNAAPGDKRVSRESSIHGVKIKGNYQGMTA